MSTSSQLYLNAVYQQAEDDSLAKAGPQQLTYAEIPKFPYASYNEKYPPGNRTKDKPRPAWAPEDFVEHSFLSTRPSPFELRNLFKQVRNHFEKLSPVTIESESEKFDKAHSTRYPLPPPATEKEDTYYIVRIRTHHRFKHSLRQRVIMEFLCKHVDNYVVAWRIITCFAEFRSALWCLFTDSSSLNDKGVLKDKCNETRYSHTYTKHLESVKFYDGVLDDVEKFLTVLYRKPKLKPSKEGRLMFETIFVLLGECPRFGPLEEGVCCSIMFWNRALAGCVAVGRLFDLIKNWRSLSYTTFCLLLLLLEESLVDKIKQELREDETDLAALIEEVRDNRAVLGRRFEAIFASKKALDAFPALKQETERLLAEPDQMRPYVTATLAPSVRGKASLDQLIHRFLYLLKFDKVVVPGILAMKGGYEGPLGIHFSAETEDGQS